MKINTLMTRKVNVVSADDVLQKAAQLMSDSDCGALPVRESGRLVGMVTDRDITVRAVAQGMPPEACRVRDVMSPKVLYVFDDESVEDAARNMRDLRLRRLPVLDRSKHLVGIISLSDLAHIHTGTAGEVLKEIAQPVT